MLRLFAMLAVAADAQDLHVSVLIGNDNNPGTKTQPFKTIQKCVDALVVTTYEESLGELCDGSLGFGGMPSNDLELCADLCRLSGDCEFFVVQEQAEKFWCKKAGTCGSGANTSLPKYRAKPSVEFAPHPRNCIVGEGAYYESVSIHHVKGSAESPVAIRAASNSNVSLHGTIEVKNWTLHQHLPLTSGGEAILWESMPLDQNVWQLWMQPHGQNKTTPQAHKRFEMMVPARWPNARFSDRSVFLREFWGKQRHSASHGCSNDCSLHGCLQAHGYKKATECVSEQARSGLLIDDGSGTRNLSAATWNGSLLNATGAIAVMNSGSWQTFQQVVSHHTPGSDRFNYAADFVLSKFETNGYFLEGKKEFLDGPEEWWIDTSTRKVYLITDDGQSPSTSQREVRGKTNDYCISISHTTHLTIHGFHIFGCTIKSAPMYPYFAGPLTISSNELFFPSVTKRALGHPMLDKSPSMTWLYTWGRSNNDEQLPLTLFNNTWFGAEGTALNYRAQVTVDNNLFFNNDWTGVEGRDGSIGLAVIVGTGKTNTTVFTHNSMLYNGPSVTYAVDSAGALVKGNIVAGQCFGMIQNDGSHIQTMTKRQNHTRIEDNWGFDSPKGSFRFDDAAQCLSNKPDCIGHFGTMRRNVDMGTRGIMVKGNNHVVSNNLAIDSELRVYDKFKNNDCPLRCMNKKTTVRGNLGTALEIRRSQEILADPNGQDLYNSATDTSQLRLMMPGYEHHDFRPLKASLLVGFGPYTARDPATPAPSEYFIPGQKAYRASYPIPSNGDLVDYNLTDVMFRPALGALRHRVYLGCHKGAVSAAGINASCSKLQAMEVVLEAPFNVQPIRAAIIGACPEYFWRVDAELMDGKIVRGDLWEFAFELGDATASSQHLTPVDEGIANLAWGKDKTWEVGSSKFFTSDSVQLGGRPSNIEGVHFDYYVKFHVSNLQGARLRKATFVMTKLASTLSDELRPEYYADDEDDHLFAWAIPVQASTWQQSSLSRRFVEDTINGAQQSLGVQHDIGHTGVATFDMASAITDSQGRIIEGEYSVRVSTGTRRRQGTPEHFNGIYATKGNKMAPPQLQLELELPEAPQLLVQTSSDEAADEGASRKAVLSWPAGSYLKDAEKHISTTELVVPLESTRISGRQGGNTPWGGGDATHPVGLRSCDYTAQGGAQQHTPYEWFVKFNVSEFRGKNLTSVMLAVSKCKSSAACVSECQAKGTCTCTGTDDGKRTCGGSSIDSPYEAADDDLHLWHVPNTWTKDWVFADYKQSWGVAYSNCNQEMLLEGQGSLAYSRYVGVASSVGETGTASFNIKHLVQHAANSADGIISLRFTVNGTAQRFYIPQGTSGGPVLSAVVHSAVPEDARWYEVQQQTWDTQGIEPSASFASVYEGGNLTNTVETASSNSSLVRVRAVTRATMPDAVAVKSSWSYVALFREDGICSIPLPATRRLAALERPAPSKLFLGFSSIDSSAQILSPPLVAILFIGSSLLLGWQ